MGRETANGTRRAEWIGGMGRDLRRVLKGGRAEIMRNGIACLLLAFGLPCAAAEDFHRSYSLPPGGHIAVSNVLGDIKISGYKGKSVEIVGYKKGPEKDRIEIRDISFGNRIDLQTVYPPFAENSTVVDIEIQVPESVPYNLSRVSTIRGNVEVSHAAGALRAESVRGTVRIRDVCCMVSASTMSGNILFEIDRVFGRGNMRFSSISGNIEVRAPADLDALIDMSSLSGTLKADFPIEIQESRYGPGRSARGRLGEGKLILFMRSVHGTVRLSQK